MKKVVIMPDSFKGSMPASEVAMILKESVKSHFPEAKIETLAISDGGEGFLSFYQQVFPESEKHFSKTYDANHQVILAPYLVHDEKIIIESAQIVAYDEDKGNVYDKSSYGIGYLIDQLSKRYPQKRFILSVGGTSSIDMGLGSMVALGAVFEDSKGKEIFPIPRNVDQISRVLCHNLRKGLDVQIVSDVRNPFYGADGGLFEYSPQKGACEEDLFQLEKSYQKIIPQDDDKACYGSGGGITAAFAHFLNAKIQLGMDFLFEILNIEEVFKTSDCILTAEGKIDQQSFQGKVIGQIAQKALVYDVPVFAFAGEVYLNTLRPQENLYCIAIHSNQPSMENYKQSSQKSLRNSCDLLMALLDTKIQE